jgi:hypothetical protein
MAITTDHRLFSIFNPALNGRVDRLINKQRPPDRGKDPVAQGADLRITIDPALELGAEGGDQHGGQLIFQRCSLSWC